MSVQGQLRTNGTRRFYGSSAPIPAVGRAPIRAELAAIAGPGGAMARPAAFARLTGEDRVTAAPSHREHTAREDHRGAQDAGQIGPLAEDQECGAPSED
jgi:hypothetical protein